MAPEISIVVTCYNYGKYVANCLDSIVRQTFDNYEVIVVDDGSTDNSQKEITPFLKDKRFRCIRQKNSGQANAKNTGIRNSKGIFVAFLDADDMWEPEKLEKQVKLFGNPEIGVVYSRARYIDAHGEPIDLELKAKYLQPRRGRVTEWLIFDNFVPFSSSIVRRECFEKTGLFDESLQMGIDWDLWLRISTHYEFDYLDEKLLIYRIGHAGQMSKNLRVRQKCADRILRRFQSEHKSLFPNSRWRQAWAYSYLNRAKHFHNKSLKKSLYYIIRAILLDPAHTKALLSRLGTQKF